MSVDYTTADGTATAGSDYITTSGRLIIPALTGSIDISVPILEDNRVETAETFTLVLSNPSRGKLAEKSTATATITDNDVNDPPTGEVTIDGTPTQGVTLSAVTFTYQWLADDVEITGAEESTYTLTQSEVGKTITVTASSQRESSS